MTAVQESQRILYVKLKQVCRFKYSILRTCRGVGCHRERSKHLACKNLPHDDGLVSLLEVAGHDVCLTRRELNYLVNVSVMTGNDPRQKYSTRSDWWFSTHKLDLNSTRCGEPAFHARL